MRCGAASSSVGNSTFTADGQQHLNKSRATDLVLQQKQFVVSRQAELGSPGQHLPAHIQAIIGNDDLPALVAFWRG